VKFLARNLALLTGALVMSSCGIFGGDDDELEPAVLLKFDTKVSIKKLWSTKLGGESDFLRVALQPVGDGHRIYAASRDGNVSAFDPETGKQLWRTKLDIDLSAGPGVGDGLVAVVTTDGYLIVLDAGNGGENWRSYVAGESLATPLVRAELVIVQTVDNRLRAFSAFGGAARWTIEQSTPPLTMRGTAAPVPVGANVVAGFDNGRVVAVDLASGSVEWETLLSPPTGRSDLDRLSDVDGAMAVVGQDIYAAGYQGRIASIAAESGQILWAREISSYTGVSADWNNLYTVQDGGELIALSRRTGAEIWRQDALLRREPTLPVSFNSTVAVGDFEGYVHFFSNVDGEPVARVRVGSKAITSDPVVVANRLYVQSDAGTLAVFVVPQPARKRDAPDIADEGA
jgi:outer membrane protein assembly factor BamB